MDYIAPYAAFFGKLQKGDILLSVGGHPIGVDGKIQYGRERIDFKVIFDLSQVGDAID